MTRLQGQDERFRQRMLLGVELLIVTGMIALGYHPEEGMSSSFIILMTLGVMLFLFHVLQRRDIERQVQAMKSQLELLAVDREQFERLEHDEAERLAAQQEEEARQRAVREAESSAQHALKGETVQELSDAFFQVLGGEYELVQGLYYAPSGEETYRLTTSYAFFSEGEVLEQFSRGETLLGQVAREGQHQYLDHIPSDYRVIVSGLGRSTPNHLLIYPLRGEAAKKDLGVLELAFFRHLETTDRLLIERLIESFERALEPLINEEARP